MVKPILILGGIALIGYAGYSYYTIQSNLLINSNYQIVDITVSKIDLENITLNISVRFDNNSAINVTIKQIYLDIYYNDNIIGNVQQVIETTINPKQSSIINLIANVSFASSFDTVKDNIGGILGLGGSKSIDIVAKGTASVKSGLVSLKAPLEFEKVLNL
jgi:LEA14-like dessication related protein